jgi:hypothetical protein
MSERRRANRFVIPDASQGTFRMMQDVLVERLDEDRVSVLAEISLPPGESLLLELPGGTGARSVVSVEVVTSEKETLHDVLRYRTILRVVEPAPGRRDQTGPVS